VPSGSTSALRAFEVRSGPYSNVHQGVGAQRYALRLKSASSQLAYWEGGRLRIANYLTGQTFASNPVTLELIRFFFTPRTIRGALIEFRTYTRESVGAAIVELVKAQLLLEYGSATWRRDTLLASSWRPWLPAAAFHFMTKDTPYLDPDRSVEEAIRSLPAAPAPPQFKKIRNAASIPLPSRQVAEDSFFDTLRCRRTHRQFAAGPVSLENVSMLLHATWGVQGYWQTPVYGKLAYKTSPSGGARHPGEVYVMALRVAGLKRGIYHYQAKNHRLALMPAKASARLATACCVGQSYFGAAAALFFMTAVFARTMWKYDIPRAYRVVLLETGHLCQTFCLTATRLGLAPFCTAAFKDSLIEKTLELDGISESVLYVAGVGLLPNRKNTVGPPSAL
jgi:SagB-type dehydrogenase family enzyme